MLAGWIGFDFDGAGSRPSGEVDLLDDDAAVAETADSDLAAVLETGFEERLLGGRDPAFLVDDGVAGLAETTVAIGWLDGSG